MVDTHTKWSQDTHTQGRKGLTVVTTHPTITHIIGASTPVGDKMAKGGAAHCRPWKCLHLPPPRPTWYRTGLKRRKKQAHGAQLALEGRGMLLEALLSSMPALSETTKWLGFGV